MFPIRRFEKETTSGVTFQRVHRGPYEDPEVGYVSDRGTFYGDAESMGKRMLKAAKARNRSYERKCWILFALA
jgi:hypothetical protein